MDGIWVDRTRKTTCRGRVGIIVPRPASLEVEQRKRPQFNTGGVELKVGWSVGFAPRMNKKNPTAHTPIFTTLLDAN